MTKTKKNSNCNIKLYVFSRCFLQFIFYNLFFNIYILENVTNNIVTLFLYYLIGIVIALLLYYPFFKILNKKNSIMAL